jgi:hypothetical protein
LCLSLDGILAGNLLGSSKELGAFSVRKRVGEDAVLRIGGERVLGRGKRCNRQVLRNRHMAGSRSSAGGFGWESVREDESQKSKVVGIRASLKDRILLDSLPVPGSLRTCAQDTTSFNKGRPIGLAHCRKISAEEALLEQTDVWSARKDSDKDDGVNGVRAC